jgi:hypothetical protein
LADATTSGGQAGLEAFLLPGHPLFQRRRWCVVSVLGSYVTQQHGQLPQLTLVGLGWTHDRRQHPVEIGKAGEAQPIQR